MKIELRKLSNIKPYPGNPRQSDAAVNAVANQKPEPHSERKCNVRSYPS